MKYNDIKGSVNFKGNPLNKLAKSLPDKRDTLKGVCWQVDWFDFKYLQQILFKLFKSKYLQKKMIYIKKIQQII